ncbi:Uroporphyrinogen III synthase HEM4 [Methanosalsum zhilinae DSM 4017]|uniref:Uroporphyrinogen III synthase HEM4 n=1 Tax=Methanosalsum zhilinae (strain DSM 4017 / NBRC 107636 / OCM 62 / WeN5) TaxID=679901 RepID=F7XNE9_METZD|nr:uroporphyrinogen-III synthase [Methanosalsum zhilinae]AEH61199.1 Uroporphyrinogen III synthase HEM4 [Methanosalsum zhilinae DSM 4017]
MNKENDSPVLAIMRPERYLDESSRLARSMGFDPLAVPFVELVDNTDEGFDPFIERVLEKKSDYVIFTSANGIVFTLKKLAQSRKQEFIDALNTTKVVAIGPNTRRELEKYKIRTYSVPDVYSSQGMVKHLCSSVKNRVIEIPRSSYGAPELVSGLKDCGAEVFETHVYTLRMLAGEDQKELIESAVNGQISAFAFTSSMMVHSFFKLAESLGLTDKIISSLNSSVVAAIGEPTARTLNKYNIQVDLIPDNYVFEEVLKKIRQYLCDPDSC